MALIYITLEQKVCSQMITGNALVEKEFQRIGIVG